MDSKKGIEKVTPVDAQVVGLPDPSSLQSEMNDAAMANPPKERAGSSVGSPISHDETLRQESYCLFVRVLRDSDAILDQDRRLPEHCWNAGISKDICEARVGVRLGTFSIDLLSDVEFLVYKLPKTGRGMTHAESTLFVDLIGGGYLWGGVPAEVFVTQRTMPQARRDKVRT